ncbi:hypothetical protein GOV09_04240 [Candidatus Woesearchaeota archaeon]|nr:hypothetical protein [Candidatus Woesearchaeota archaeon]
MSIPELGKEEKDDVRKDLLAAYRKVATLRMMHEEFSEVLKRVGEFAKSAELLGERF